MLDKNELKFFIEDIQSEEVAALLAVRISEFSGETLSGASPSHVTTITCNPPEGWSDSDRRRIDAALHDIADVFRARFASKAA